MLQKWGLFWITLIGTILLALAAAVPPSPKGLDTPLDEFSSARAMTDVRIIAAKPHPTGSEENAKVRSYLVDRLEELGMDVSLDESQLNERGLKRLSRWSGETKTEQPIVNIIGVLPGQDRTKKALLLMAHHDTVWGSPGASDDTVGITSILEIARVLKDMDNRQRDLIVLLTDAEEIGLVGARHFFKEHPLSGAIGAIINFEARGGGGTANMFQTSANNGHAAKLYARYVKDPSASSLSIFVYNILPNDTDLTPALEKDYTAYNIANIGRAGLYHSPKITPDALDESTLQHMGSQGLDLARALITQEALPVQSPNATFFDLFGFFTVLYPPFLGWVFLIIAGICYLLSIRTDPRRKNIVSGCLKMLAFLLIGGLALYLLNFISGSNASPNYYDRLAAIPILEGVALFLSLGFFFSVFGASKSSASQRFGAALPLFILGLIGQIFAPTAAYFITGAILLTAISSLAAERLNQNTLRPILISALIAIVFGYMVFLGHFLMLGVGPDMLTLAILPAAIAATAIMPVYPGLTQRASSYGAVTCLIIATLLALWIRLDPVASTVPLY